MRLVLGVGKDLIFTTISAVESAEILIHEDGTNFTGPEKKDYVLGKISKFLSEVNWTEPSKKIINLIIELAVNYVKGSNG